MTYVYETTTPEQPVRRFEVNQSIKDEPLRTHPATGEPVRRVITGGSGVIVAGSAPAPKARGGCGAGCGCH